MRRRSTPSVVVATMVGVLVALPVVSAPTPVVAATLTRCPSGATLLVDGKCEVTFTSNATWTVPSFVESIDVLAVGGGGGGGGATAYQVSPGSDKGAYSGGGGGGGNVVACRLDVSVGSDQLSVTVGAGGVGGEATVINGTFLGSAILVTGKAGGNGGTSGVPGCEATGGTGGGASNGEFNKGNGLGYLAAGGGRSGNNNNGGVG